MKCIILATFLITTTSASAATITRDGDRLTLSGSIGEADAVVFEIQLNDSVRTVALNSTGGYVSEAFAIGRAIRKRRLDTVVPANASCESACALIWSAGRRRTVDGRLAMHCATTAAAPEQCDPAARKDMLAYLKAMNAPPGVIMLEEAAGSSAALYWERAQLAADEGIIEDDEPPPIYTPPPRRPPPRYYGPTPYTPPPVYYPPPPITFPWGPCPISMLLSFGTVCI